MGELSEKRWAVISERGCEAEGLPYAEAAGLVRRLSAERISGLCVVTQEAARRLRLGTGASANGGRPPARKAARPRRAAKKS